MTSKISEYRQYDVYTYDVNEMLRQKICGINKRLILSKCINGVINKIIILFG